MLSNDLQDVLNEMDLFDQTLNGHEKLTTTDYKQKLDIWGNLTTINDKDKENSIMLQSSFQEEQTYFDLEEILAKDSNDFLLPDEDYQISTRPRFNVDSTSDDVETTLKRRHMLTGLPSRSVTYSSCDSICSDDSSMTSPTSPSTTIDFLDNNNNISWLTDQLYSNTIALEQNDSNSTLTQQYPDSTEENSGDLSISEYLNFDSTTLLEQNLITKTQLFDNINTRQEDNTKTFRLYQNTDDVQEKAKRVLDLQHFKALYDAKLQAKCLKVEDSVDITEKLEEKRNTNTKEKTYTKIKTKIGKIKRERKNRRKIRQQPNRCYHMWDFFRDILSKRIHPDSNCITWMNEKEMEFCITNTRELANLWGQVKQSKTMTYDKMSRAIRYYCSLDILKKVEGKRLQFRFSNGKMWTKNMK